MQLISMNLDNFRSFTKMSVTFDPKLTVFVGGNGAGKTAILEALAIFLEQIPLFVNNCTKNTLHVSRIRVGADVTELGYTVSWGMQDYDVVFRYKKRGNSAVDENILKRNIAFIDTLKTSSIPIVVYYSAKRGIDEDTSEKVSHATPEDAYTKAFEAHIDFSSTLTWFLEKSSQEALEAVRKKNLDHRISELDAVRKAVSRALGDYDEPFVAESPPKLYITRKEAPDIPLTIQHLSDGYRTMLALVMDLARRMALAKESANCAEGESILHTPGIVLIDEVELHLHPSWQQTVVPRLLEIFPNVQFIVTTNSPQVITSLEAAHIRILDKSGMVRTAPQGTWGAEASRVMKQIFSVDTRPPSQAREELEEYRELVYADKWKTDRALELRKILDVRYGEQEPELVEVDLHIENRTWEMSEESEKSKKSGGA